MSKSVNWFPLFRSLMEESPEFRAVTPTEKLYYWWLLSEANSNDGQPFYQSDEKIAATLATTSKTVRRARKRFGDLGWIKYTSGGLVDDRRLATTYSFVQWALVPSAGADTGERDFFAKMHRYAFQALLDSVRRKTLIHADLITYVYLSYVRSRNDKVMARNGSFSITKSNLCKLTGLTNAPVRVKHLYDAPVFGVKERLFELQDGHHYFTFSKWAGFADPIENENNRKNLERYGSDIEKAVAERRVTADAWKTMPATNLPQFYESEVQHLLPKKRYTLPPHNSAARKLIALGESVGPYRVATAITAFLKGQAERRGRYAWRVEAFLEDYAALMSAAAGRQ